MRRGRDLPHLARPGRRHDERISLLIRDLADVVAEAAPVALLRPPLPPAVSQGQHSLQLVLERGDDEHVGARTSDTAPPSCDTAPPSRETASSGDPSLVGWMRSRYPPAMLARKARVIGGRLVFDVPTTLPEGTEVDVITPDEEPIDLDEQERVRLEEALSASWADARAGRTRPFDELLAELRARG
jgi:hypothetical protein